jgi:hypothetical protein
MTVAATIVTLEHDHVLIRAKDDREWYVDRRDIDPKLLREGQAVNMNHDSDGFVTSITSRKPDELPPEIRGRIEEMRSWCETL